MNSIASIDLKMLSSDDTSDVTRKRVLKKTVSQEDCASDRIPPNSDKLFDSLPWLNIMADIAITAAIAEIKVHFYSPSKSFYSRTAFYVLLATCCVF